MDIRFVNKNDEIINATKLSIKVNNRFLIGESVEGKTTIIEDYETWGEAKDVLRKIGDALLNDKEISQEEIIIDLRKKEKGEEK